MLGYEHASKKNYSKAVDYFTEAAEHGNAVAQFKLSEFSISGLGVSKDHKKGLDSLKKAADQDLIIAQISYGSYLTDGKHLKQDLTRSLMWLNLALDPQRDHSKTDKKTLLEQA